MRATVITIESIQNRVSLILEYEEQVEQSSIPEDNNIFYRTASELRTCEKATLIKALHYFEDQLNVLANDPVVSQYLKSVQN